MPVLIKGGIVSGQHGLARIVLCSPGCRWRSKPNGSLLPALRQSEGDTGAVDRGVPAQIRVGWAELDRKLGSECLDQRITQEAGQTDRGGRFEVGAIIEAPSGHQLS